MRVCLDPGHGAGTGARGNGLVEDVLALDFARRIGHHLRLRKAETVMTRGDDGFVTLASRGALAVRTKCGLFLSIHLNAAASPSARGCECFAAAGDERSLKIAARLTAALSSMGLKNRGAKYDTQSAHGSLRVLRDTYKNMPALLLEIGFLTNKADAELLGNKLFREKVSIKVAETLMSITA